MVSDLLVVVWCAASQSDATMENSFNMDFILKYFSTSDEGSKRNQHDIANQKLNLNIMMTSSIGNIFRATGILCEEFTGYLWHGRAWTNN